MRQQCEGVGQLRLRQQLAATYLVKLVTQLRPPRITEHPADLVVAKNEPAMLNCQADGKQPVTIEWYKDGELVRTHPADPKSHRVLLPSGSLFFLKVVQGKKEQDAGTYWCVARNDGGHVFSKNATLEIAVLRDDFRLSPKNLHVSVGDTAILECVPPRGHPEPSVKWKKNNDLLVFPINRMQIEENGNLVINDVRQGDSGRYFCVAENMVGIRESVPALLSVHVKPFLMKPPEDITSIANENVLFECKVGGDPAPNIIWRRQDGKMPIGRAQIQEDKSLQIQHVTPADEGLYICEAENPVGTVSASATLTVHSRPTFLVSPRDQRIGLNGIASFECVTTGNPPPSVFWTKEGNQVLMFPGQPHGRFSVTAEGELKISGVRREDEGYYVCSALSVAGSSMAKAYLEVTAMADVPPPIIRVGPANQTLPVKTAAMLPCQSSGNPTPMISWSMNGDPINGNDPRITVLDSGTLQIDDLQLSDSGLYTCTASSESGETSWSASLSVESPTNPNIIFHRTSDLSLFPGAPVKPFASNITETSLVLTWKRIPKMVGLIVESFSSDLQSGWVIVAHRISGDTYLVQNLRPDTSYVFLVRAENSYGLGEPSPVSEVYRTLGLHRSVPDFDLDEARIRLGNNVVELKNVKAISSTEIRLLWNIKSAENYVEGFYIRFRDMSGGSQKYNMVTVLNAGASSYVVINLRKFTKYEFFLVPFYKTVDGMPSNSKSEQTLEDVPSAPPDNVQIRIVNLTSAIIRWAPPPPQHRNGILLGYQIHIKGNGSVLHSNLSTNATSTSVSLYNLTVGALYTVRSVAYTRVGLGPFSAPIVLRMDPTLLQMTEHSNGSLTQTLHDIARQPWFIVMIGGLIFLVLGVFCIMLFLKRRAAKKKALSTSLTAEELTRANLNARNTVWIERGWAPPDIDKDGNLSETKLLNCTNNDDNNVPDYAEVDTRSLKTFYKKETTPVLAPYATTTLINSVQKRLNMPDADHGFIPIPHGKDSRTSGSDDSCVKTELSSDTNHTDSRSNAECLLEQSEAASPTSDSSSYIMDENGLILHKNRYKPPLRTSTNTKPTMMPSMSQTLSRSSVSSNGPHVGIQSPLMTKRPQMSSPRALPNDLERGPTPPMRLISQQNMIPGTSSFPVMDRAIQSSLPSLISEPTGKGQYMAHRSPFRMDFAGACQLKPGHIDPTPEYSDIDHYAQTSVTTPESSIAAGDLDCVSASMMGNWNCVTDNSQSSCTSARSSVASSSDGSFYTEADFANAVVRAAENAGLRVDGSMVTDPNLRGKRQLPRYAKSRSPYSTDSNYSTTRDQPYFMAKANRKKPFPDNSQKSSQDEPPTYSKPIYPTMGLRTSSLPDSQELNPYLSLRRKAERGQNPSYGHSSNHLPINNTMSHILDHSKNSSKPAVRTVVMTHGKAADNFQETSAV
uniref:Roundabout n=1 Tax=Strigamia maritima TaxID=126957 RepID=T1JDC0_STRMM